MSYKVMATNRGGAGRATYKVAVSTLGDGSVMSIYIAPDVMVKLGWAPDARVSIEYDDTTRHSLVRLARGSERGFKLVTRTRGGGVISPSSFSFKREDWMPNPPRILAAENVMLLAGIDPTEGPTTRALRYVEFRWPEECFN